ncbi:ABC transporter permease [Terasakiella sp. A23]|uniref:MlaE family ABC transporter permease n=1 Tax=Terasakiella sp. FCG-A23 TaxID=3080561 RepID=UPI002953D7F1|nr:ABC transporter permease [Terasakiella sp. A23]MDV7339987.1 ABC transporter permease [Terasakiella sp. A23]
MSENEAKQGPIAQKVENIGRTTMMGVGVIGYCATLIWETLYWAIRGKSMGQPIRLSAVVDQMMEIGIRAIPIVALLALAVGMMLAIQGIYTLSIFGAESQVTYGIAFSVVREFSPLITGILVAGRSGSALAARIGIMTINQEVDALSVMGINPVRFLVAPAMFAMLIMMPCLTFLSDVVGLLGGGLYVALDLKISLSAYWADILKIISNGDLTHGLMKSVLFGVLIVIIGVANGAGVQGGAEGVGKVTTRAVVQSISAIVITDMFFAFMVTR